MMVDLVGGMVAGMAADSEMMGTKGMISAWGKRC